MASNVGLDHALKSILHEYLHEGECGQDTSTYAGRLTGLCSPNDEDSAEMFCWTLWKAFIEIAQTVPSDAAQSHIDKLVHLVKAIKESKPLRNSDGGNVTVWGGECWKDLPVLGPAMREHSNTMPSNAEELSAHLRKNLFAARLTHLKVADFALYGLWAMSEAVEGEVPWTPCPAQSWSIAIAHAWMTAAGESLIVLNEDLGRLGKGGSLWKGKSGWCRERWLFWQQRFEELSSSRDLEDESRRLAKEVVDQIDLLLLHASRRPDRNGLQ